MSPTEVILFTGLAIACVSDLRTQKIPNVLNLSLILLGLLVNATGSGLGLKFALAGLGAAFVVHYGLWAAGVEKAGDSKLMMGVGALVGWAEMMESTLWMLILLIPVGLVVLAMRGRLGNLKLAAQWTAFKSQGIDMGERPEPTYMAYAPVIGMGVVAAHYTSVLDFFS